MLELTESRIIRMAARCYRVKKFYIIVFLQRVYGGKYTTEQLQHLFFAFWTSKDGYNLSLAIEMYVRLMRFNVAQFLREMFPKYSTPRILN